MHPTVMISTKTGISAENQSILEVNANAMSSLGIWDAIKYSFFRDCTILYLVCTGSKHLSIFNFYHSKSGALHMKLTE